MSLAHFCFIVVYLIGVQESTAEQSQYTSIFDDERIVWAEEDDHRTSLRVAKGRVEELFSTSCIQVDTLADITYRQVKMWPEENQQCEGFNYGGNVRVSKVSHASAYRRTHDKYSSHHYVQKRALPPRLKSLPLHIAMDPLRKEIFVADNRRQEIARIYQQADDSGYAALYVGTSSRVNGIAVDWVNSNLYWTDAAYDSIMKMHTRNISDVRVFTDEGVDEPFGIVVHPKKSLLIWSDNGADPSIEACHLDGSMRHTLYNGNFIGRPSSMTIDTEHDWLFWIDASSQTIVMFTINGKKSRKLFHITGSHPVSVFMLRNIVAVGSMDNNVLILYNVSSRTNKQIHLNGRPYGIAVSELSYSEADVQLKKYGRKDQTDCRSISCDETCPQYMGALERRCKAEKTNTDFKLRNLMYGILLISKSDGVYALPRNFADASYQSTTLVMSHSHLHSIATDSYRNMLYAYDGVKKQIKVVDMVNGSQFERFSLACGDVRGLAIDGLNGNVYWVDRAYKHIMLARNDGKFAKIIIRQKSPQLQSIAVDASEGYIFWSDIDVHMPSVQKSGLDGANIEAILIFPQVKSPMFISLDTKNKRLFVADSSFGEGVIMSCSYYGENLMRHHEFGSSGEIITAMTLYNDYLMFVLKSTKTGMSHMNVLDIVTEKLIHVRESSSDIRDLHFNNHNHVSRPVSGFCHEHNGGCDQICVSSKQGKLCLCSFGYNLISGLCTSEPVTDRFLLIADQKLAQLLQLDLYYMEFHALPVCCLQKPFGTVYDPVGSKVYWTDAALGTIGRANLNGTHQEIIYISDTIFPMDLELDVSSRLLYFTIDLLSEIGVLSIDSLKHKRIKTNLRHIGVLALIPTRGLMFVTENYANSSTLRLLTMDGQKVNIDYNLFTRLKGLAVYAEDIYFLHGARTVISSMSVDNRHSDVVLLNEDPDGGEIAVDGDFLYWIDTLSGSVKRRSKLKAGQTVILGERGVLLDPSDVYLYSTFNTNFQDTECNTQDVCQDMCLPSGNTHSCVSADDDGGVNLNGESNKGFCKVPRITNGEVEDNRPGNTVPDGLSIKVTCHTGYKASNSSTALCSNGVWSCKIVCMPDVSYRIVGNSQRGYTQIIKSSTFLVPYNITTLDVICIGGGGGGFDLESFSTTNIRNAGDGGVSKFGKYLQASGGGGGNRNEGGAGGMGTIAYGGDGSTDRCGSGGSAGQTSGGTQLIHGSSTHPYCGSGGLSFPCSKHEQLQREGGKSGPGGTPREESNAGLYGGGAGSGTGGSGGGGGYSRKTVSVKPGEIVNVEVGEDGQPSFGKAGKGIVVIAWGGKTLPAKG